jgi:uncharacterized protein
MTQAKSFGEKRGTCPICRAPSADDYRPFCSRRCADVDLSRWLRGTYAIPGEADDDAASDPAPAEPNQQD